MGLRIRVGIATGALLVFAAGCGGSEAQQIASDACDMIEQAFSGEGDVEAMMEMQQDFEELDERIEEADLSEEDMEEAMRDACPDVVDGFGDFGL